MSFSGRPTKSIHELEREFELCLATPDWRDAVARLVEQNPGHAATLTSWLRGLDAPGALLASVPQPALPERIGDYVILRLLGQGGMGVIYEALQETPVRRRVALKVMRCGLDTPEAVIRFRFERESLARMEHPAIAKVYDAGQTEGGQAFVVMELVPGVAITRYCAEHQLDVRARVALLADVCDAVQHAHLRGIMHRDLKPSNLLTNEVDGRAAVKVIDFGLARETLGQGVTRVGHVVGTPEYMSPEQAGASLHDVDTRTDVYSLGVVLYELLTGQLPIPGLRAVGLAQMQQLLREGATIVPSRRARIDAPAARDLDSITMKALAPEPDLRYQSSRALAEDLRRYLDGLPVGARPQSFGYRARRFVGRHRWQTGFAAALGACALVMLGWATTHRVLGAERELSRERAQQVQLGRMRTELPRLWDFGGKFIQSDTSADYVAWTDQYVRGFQGLGLGALVAAPADEAATEFARLATPSASAGALVREALYQLGLVLARAQAPAALQVQGGLEPKLAPTPNETERRAQVARIERLRDRPDVAMLWHRVTLLLRRIEPDAARRDCLNAWFVWCEERRDVLDEPLRRLDQLDPAGLTWLGEVVLGIRGSAAAIPILERACAHDPGSFRANFFASLAHSSSKKVEDLQRAVEYGCRATSLASDSSWAWTNLGLACAEQAVVMERLFAVPGAETRPGLVNLITSRKQQAEKSYRLALELRPDSTATRINLANLCAKDPRVYEEILSAIVADQPNCLLAWQNLAGHAYHRRDLRREIECRRRCVACDPASATLQRDLGMVLVEAVFGGKAADDGEAQRWLEEAATTLEAAHRLSPLKIDSHQALGIVLVELGRWPEAIGHLEQSLELRTVDLSAPSARISPEDHGKRLRELTMTLGRWTKRSMRPADAAMAARLVAIENQVRDLAGRCLQKQ